jgi:hypothetical protein
MLGKGDADDEKSHGHNSLAILALVSLHARFLLPNRAQILL